MRQPAVHNLLFALETPQFGVWRCKKECAQHGAAPAGDHQEQGGPALRGTAAGKAGVGKSHSILESQDSCIESKAGQKKDSAFGAGL